MIQSSRSAILKTGISAPYFDEHFKLVRVVDTVSDRRVIWQYSIGEYVAILNDAVGFYTDDKGKRINIHAVRNVLSSSHDIKKTISKKRAEKLMYKCIGKYIPGEVVFQSFGNGLRASLVFTASSIQIAQKERDEDVRNASKNNQKREDKLKPLDNKPEVDSIEDTENENEGDVPLIFTGLVNLETSTCTKGIAQVEHPRP